MRVHLISAFPGCGKSTLVKKFHKVQDSDSSLFPKSEFPRNYLKHLRDLAVAGTPSMISTHLEVRQGLERMGLSYIVVYPHFECKEEYLQRYRDRQSPQAFIDLLDRMWETWINALRDSEARQIILNPGQYLSDVLTYKEDEQGRPQLWI